MSTKTMTPIRGKRIRVTSLNSCGQITAASKQIVTDGFVTVTLSPQVEDGTDIQLKNANGALCINEKGNPTFTGIGVEVSFCDVNPSLLPMVSNAESYENFSSDVTGFTLPEGEITGRFAFELWTGLAGLACGSGGEEASGYLLLPLVASGTLGNLEIGSESAVSFTLTKSSTRGSNNWGVGPYSVIDGGGSSVNEVQTVTITGTPTGGTFSLTFAGQTTSNLAHSSTSSQVQTALRALTNIGPTGVTVTGGPGPGTAYTITFAGNLAGQGVPQIVAQHLFTGGSSPQIVTATTTQGSSGSGKLPTALDPADHLLMLLTKAAPPAVNNEPTAVPA